MVGYLGEESQVCGDRAVWFFWREKGGEGREGVNELGNAVKKCGYEILHVKKSAVDAPGILV